MLARFLYKDNARKTKKYHSNKKKMKKLFFVIASVAATVLTACDGNEGKITANQLNGEWEPVWIYDVDSIIGDIPFLGFDTKVEGFRNCRIPYLNGGLFERDILDKNSCHFPASYFDSLLTMLSQYNFTIDENDPNDAEVGVDPEMLGRIFENLLELERGNRQKTMQRKDM